MSIRLLAPADVPGAMRLKAAAGWNQTEADWMSLLELEPRGCFGIDADGVLAATATAVRYGTELAWIGMVLTDPAYRGRGFARGLMEHALEWLEGTAVVKLDATDMGRPLYAKLGFADEAPVERWGRDPAWTGHPAELPRGFDAELDRQAFGADRKAVLCRAAIDCAEIAGGFAMGRPGSRARYFGPCVARSETAARRLLDWFLSHHGGEMVYWDLLPGNAAAVRLAEEYGFRRFRSLIRMARPAGAQLPRRDEFVYAIAGFEFG
jgi:GNAT superfamily N-acetyltransferase